eukprot:12916647-Prorocentrum_lima.AAC.1
MTEQALLPLATAMRKLPAQSTLCLGIDANMSMNCHVDGVHVGESVLAGIEVGDEIERGTLLFDFLA